MADQRLILPDLWQQEALRALRQGEDVVVQAPTGAGKTYIFELLMRHGHRGQAVYAVPTRALANDKRAEWQALGWDVGIATGDVSENLDAPVVVATLETQRHRFLAGRRPDLLVIDEYQMIADERRGPAYETVLALAPAQTRLLLLSGSVANPQGFEYGASITAAAQGFNNFKGLNDVGGYANLVYNYKVSDNQKYAVGVNYGKVRYFSVAGASNTQANMEGF
ncbi:DEAD/DEAH box helicase, partial [bacterium]|nr:DEAD/DEAH box helicase [bacterium]